MGFFLVVVSRGYSPGVVRKLLTAVASHVAGTGSRAHRLQQLQLLGSRAQAQQLWHIGLIPMACGDLPRSGIKPMSSALAGKSFTTEPPGNPLKYSFKTYPKAK